LGVIALALLATVMTDVTALPVEVPLIADVVAIGLCVVVVSVSGQIPSAGIGPLWPWCWCFCFQVRWIEHERRDCNVRLLRSQMTWRALLAGTALVIGSAAAAGVLTLLVMRDWLGASKSTYLPVWLVAVVGGAIWGAVVASARVRDRGGW
jgi:hypothetical protein